MNAMAKTAPLTADDLDRPDDELGKHLLALFVSAEAEKCGVPIDSIPAEFAAAVIEKVLYIEAEYERHSSLEKALRKAASADFSTAGRLLKDNIRANAKNLATANQLIRQVELRRKGPRAGGAKTKDRTQTKNAERNKQIRSAYDQLLKAKKNPRSIPGILAKRFKLSARQIKRIINQN